MPECPSNEHIAGLFALVTAVLIFILQFISEYFRRREDRRQQDILDRMNCYDQISSLIARRIYRTRRILYAAQPSNTVTMEAARTDYRDIVFEWNDSITPLLAKIEIFFGPGLRQKLENNVIPQVIAVGSHAQKFIREAASSDDIEALQRDIDSVNAETYEFDKSLCKLVLAPKFKR